MLSLDDPAQSLQNHFEERGILEIAGQKVGHVVVLVAVIDLARFFDF
jgi:hypothetical protein